jgi:hypothetical protein
VGQKKLNQVVAIVSDRKKAAEAAMTESYQMFQKEVLFKGLTRDYSSYNDSDRDTKPPERKLPSVSVKKLCEQAFSALKSSIDAVATQDFGNRSAVADIVVDGQVLVAGVPVTNMLYLEHKIKDLATMVEKMPVRDPAEEWQWNEASNSYSTPVRKTVVTRKDQVGIVLYDATDKHPAQTQLITKDVAIGEWSTREFSTAISMVEKQKLLDRIAKLSEAVKTAREEANSIKVDEVEIGDKVINHVFGGIIL